jgi:GNAT superfamily N-acetyltransferase
VDLRLRPIGPDDRPFLRRVYGSTRTEELAPIPWTENEKAAFLDSQFVAQDRHYRENYPTDRFCVVLADGEEAGRLYVTRGAEELRIVDISLLPEYRRRGIGTTLLCALLDEAAEGGIPARIHVERFNPALQLYERLGFRPVADQGVYLLMEWCQAS